MIAIIIRIMITIIIIRRAGDGKAGYSAEGGAVDRGCSGWG